MSKNLASAFALSAAALFLASCDKSGAATNAPGAAAGGTVKCMGVNECKGQGACDVPGSHSCAGQNECKGKGWVKTSQADCDAQGGQVA